MRPLNKSKNLLRLSLPILWALIILWLSLTSSPPQISGVLGWDKLLHAGAYGLLTLLLAQAFLCPPFLLDEPWWLAGSTAVAYGALLEILQLLSQTGRSAEWADLFADAIGAFLCCVLFRHALKTFSGHEQGSDTQNG